MTLDTVIIPVNDLARAKAFYTRLLATEPFADAPYYVGFMVGGVQIGLDPQGKPGGFGALPYLVCDDIRAVLEAAQADGGTLVSEPRDVGGGKLVAVLSDPEGNGLGLTQNPQDA